MRPKQRVLVKRTHAELIPRFMSDRRDDVAQLRRYVAARDMVAIQSVGHRLKGAGAGYGFTEISALGAEMEQTARQSHVDAIGPLVDRLEEYLNDVEVELI